MGEFKKNKKKIKKNLLIKSILYTLIIITFSSLSPPQNLQISSYDVGGEPLLIFGGEGPLQLAPLKEVRQVRLDLFVVFSIVFFGVCACVYVCV